MRTDTRKHLTTVALLVVAGSILMLNNSYPELFLIEWLRLAAFFIGVPLLLILVLLIYFFSN